MLRTGQKGVLSRISDGLWEKLKIKFDQSHEKCPSSGCWIWTGSQGGDGRGRLAWSTEGGTRHTLMPQRVSWLLHRGTEAPSDIVLDTSCGRQNCVSPDHLRLGFATPSRQPPYLPLEILKLRFYAKVTAVGAKKCWPWRGASNGGGYGVLCCKTRGKPASRKLLAHKVSVYLRDGVWPDRSKSVCHHCDNPICVNPAHLYIGDQKSNGIDARMRKRHETPKRMRSIKASRRLKPSQVNWARRVNAEERRLGKKPSCRCAFNSRTVAQRYGIGATTLNRILKCKRTERDTKERNDEIRRLWDSPGGHGVCLKAKKRSNVWTVDAIAAKLGVSRGTVKGILDGSMYFEEFALQTYKRRVGRDKTSQRG